MPTECQRCDAYPVPDAESNFYRQKGYGLVSVCDDCVSKDTYEKQPLSSIIVEGNYKTATQEAPKLFYSGDIVFYPNTQLNAKGAKRARDIINQARYVREDYNRHTFEQHITNMNPSYLIDPTVALYSLGVNWRATLGDYIPPIPQQYRGEIVNKYDLEEYGDMMKGAKRCLETNPPYQRRYNYEGAIRYLIAGTYYLSRAFGNDAKSPFVPNGYATRDILRDNAIGSDSPTQNDPDFDPEKADRNKDGEISDWERAVGNAVAKGIREHKEKKGAETFGADEYRNCEICESSHHESEFGYSEDEEQTMTPKGVVCNYCFGDIMFDDFKNADDRDWAKEYLESKGFPANTIEGSFEDRFGAETFEAKGYKGISSSKIQVLEKYIENGGQALDYHELPYHIQRQLEMGKVHELLYQDVNRWLQDNAPNPHHTMPSWLSAETFGAESKFDELADEIAGQYEKKGKSKEEAEKIGKATAYKVGVAKYGKRGMTNKAKAGMRKKKMGAETFEAKEKQGVCDTCGRKRWWFENKRGEISGQICGYGYTLENAKKAHETGIPADFCRGMVNNPFGAEEFGAEGLYECSECKHWNRNPVAGITKCKKCGHGSFNQVKRAETFEAPMREVYSTGMEMPVWSYELETKIGEMGENDFNYWIVKKGGSSRVQFELPAYDQQQQGGFMGYRRRDVENLIRDLNNTQKIDLMNLFNHFSDKARFNPQELYFAETFEAHEEAVEQTDANMVNEGSVEAFYGGGAKVSVSSAGIQPTANPSVDEAFNVGNQVGLDVAEQEIMNENPSVEVNYGAESGQMCEVCFGNDDLPYDSDHFTECRRCGKSVCMDCDGEMQSHPDWFKVCGECSDVLDNVHDYGGEDMSLKDSAKLGFGVGAGLLGFNVALLGIATIGGFLLNRD